MKRIIAALLCLQILFINFLIASAASAGAIKIDGVNKNNEWREYNTLFLFEKSNPGNDVDTAFMKFVFVSDNNFKVFMAAQLEPVPESFDATGFMISVDGGDFYSIIIGDGTEEKYDIVNDGLVRIEGACSYDRSGGITCELDVTVKRTATESLDCEFAVIDAQGEPSAVTGYSLVNPYYTTTQPVEQTTAEITTTEKTTKATTEKTTKTTTERTTKEKTTKATTAKTTKTTTEKTTKEKTTKTTTEKTTKEKTTKTTTEKTTKEKTTKTTTEKTTKATTEKTTKTTTAKTTTEKTTKDNNKENNKRADSGANTTFEVTEHSRRTAPARSSESYSQTKPASRETEMIPAVTQKKTAAGKKTSAETKRETVYVYEKERIVTEEPIYSGEYYASEVYETVYAQSAEMTANEDDGSLFAQKGISKATKYKIIAGVIAFIMFAVIGVAAVRTKSDAESREKEEQAPLNNKEEEPVNEEKEEEKRK